MQLNKILKGLLIALPLLTVAACSSSDDAANASDAQTTAQDAAVATAVDKADALSEQEQLQQKLRENSTVFFKFDNSEISSEYEDILAAHAKFLSNMPNVKVTIEGYADERGTPEYNIALGERRAEAVSKYLQALGVQADQISIVSYGEEKPLEMGQTESAYSKNRRAVVVY
ncbi:peptidoglycan-associated lipoprotein Pal [Vibrio rumoiensis]|uniref:Peptidoglycan-associated lipoprotein n=1 Tax=Vibrio rumoiensis 1S-45 TaxID=1188252 RepID=A0A1E5E1B4_9VIBR|nr:peptidoglycan-associated lipoprotein Pal [Vibrio rumoiensis]OEF24811.1 peptidoglycan-associated lipoprotein [Vibrio rumoiensis 1S-45]